MSRGVLSILKAYVDQIPAIWEARDVSNESLMRVRYDLMWLGNASGREACDTNAIGKCLLKYFIWEIVQGRGVHENNVIGKCLWKYLTWEISQGRGGYKMFQSPTWFPLSYLNISSGVSWKSDPRFNGKNIS